MYVYYVYSRLYIWCYITRMHYLHHFAFILS